MKPDEVDEIRDVIFDLSKESELDRAGIERVVSAMRKLFEAYQGATRRLYKLRTALRDMKRKQ